MDSKIQLDKFIDVMRSAHRETKYHERSETFKSLDKSFASTCIKVSSLIHLVLIFTLPFIYVISVEEGLEWDAHMIYCSFHFIIFLFQVFVIYRDKLHIA